MVTGFSGDVADYYAKYRRGYPPEVVDALRDAFALCGDDTVLDLGCGTGQLTLPLAPLVRSVIGMDPEPDMLRHARQAAASRGVGNATWVLGSDDDLPGVGALLGPASLAATVVGQALHWMRHEELFGSLLPLTRTGGGVAVVANGTPQWLQDADWSQALRAFLEEHFGTTLRATCGTGAEDRDRYAAALAGAGFLAVHERVVDYSEELSPDQLIGSVFSAIPLDRLPAAEDRAAFADRLRAALPPGPYREHVHVSVLVGQAS